MTQKVKQILEKYKKGSAVESKDDLEVLERYASTGMVKFGFNHKTGEGEAKLTKQGKWFFAQI